uniref:mucin-19-like isoform X8 n=1 Tax=Osmia lignaria TaxID=473952 RepID=UPI001478FC8A|nr:mucin-19-like isoform X8 [Osmia lignaria]
MVRRFSWCTTVALVVLLFVTTEGLRERSTQVDDQKTASRGSLRYNTKSLEESTTVSSFSRSRSSQDRKKFSNLERYHEETTLRSPVDSDSVFDSVRTSSEASVKRRDGKRYSPERTKSKDNENETSKVISRRVSNGRVSDPAVTERLDNKGPSVFAITTESSRSRTGRKIQTTYSTKDLKTQIPTSRRYNNKKAENTETTTASFRREGKGRSTTERIERSTRSGRSKVNNRENNSISRKGQEAALFESESVRVDIPLAVEGTENPSADVVTTSGFSVVSQRRSDTKETLRGNARTGVERSKGRGRSNDSEVAGSSRNSSRRGSSKFNDFSTTEANEQIVSSRKNTARDRSKSLESRKNAASESRSRSRGRGSENNARNGSNGVLERDAKRKAVGDRKSLDRRSRLSETTPRSAENRGQDQDSRRSRNRARPDATTILTTDVTTTIAPDTTVFADVTSESEMTSITMRPATPVASTTSSRPTTTTRPFSSTTSTTEGSGRGRGRGRGSSQGRKQQKEDFFNHGLGFRGRKPSLEGASNTRESKKPSAPKNDSQYHGNFGWTLRRRPPNANYSDNLPKAIPPTRDQTNEVIPPNELSTSTEVVTTVESSTSTLRRGFKKLQTTEESTTEADAATKGYRRGSKTFGPGKASDHEESDNYPPEFKARLTQLKTTNTKIPAPKTTSRTPLEDQPKNTFGRRSRNNSRTIEDLEYAASRDLVFKDQNFIDNPFALINGRGLRRVKRSSAALFAERSRMKLELARRLVKPELNIEENDLDATTASSFSKPKPTVLSTVDETSKVTKFVKPSQTSRRSSTEKRSKENEKASKVSASRSTVEDSSSRLARPNSKKGRIISERMVTSISVEERAAIEDTTKPYASTVHSVVTSASAEEGSATTIDSTRIRLSNFRNGKKSKEENSTNKRRIENHDTITTFKPKKPYAYQPRGTKLQEQSTTPVQTPVASSKKTYASPKYNGGQRKSQTSQEEDTDQRIKSTGVTKPTFRPRYSKRTKQKSIENKATDFEATITTKVPIATSRYSRKKAVVKATEAKSKATTEGTATQTKKLEFRPRTATYRRHSEVPTTLVEVSTKVDGTRVAITPRSTKFPATLKSTESTRSVGQEPQVNLKIANDTTQDGSGITGSSNGDSGNTNIFSPTRSTILSGNNTLLEQLRSTVAPLLNSLGNKTPVFSGSYSNVNNANSPPRITPNGSPPRFSARYKGAELFVKKQNNVYQPTVPSITSSSTTPATTVENSGSAPPIDVSSPGEPRLLTLYQALESANIRNEQLQRNANEQADRVLQVDSNATVANDISSNSNNDTTSPSVATTSPQTPDTIANTTLTPRLSEDTENTTPAVTTGAPETPATTEQVTTITEQSTITEQASTSTESSSSTEQASMNADLMSLTEQTSTDATTTTAGGLERSQVSSMMTTMEASTTAASTADGSTPGATEVASTTQTGQSTMETTTVAAVSDAAIMNTSENPESNTIPLSETTATQSVDLSSTDIPTTEAISNNMVDAETTTVVPTTTFRPRLIDLAQDILSRLQASLNATTQSSLDSTITPPTTEISNAIPDSNSTLESLSQLNGIGTPGPGELSTTGETTTPSAVGSVPTTSSATTTDPSNSMDTTSATAQGTAGSGMGQTTEITTPMTTLPSTPPSSQSSTSPSLMSTTSSSVETTTTTATMTTTTQTTTKIGRIPEQLSTTQSTSMGVVTVTPMPETTLPTMVTNANIEENLVSTEAGTTMQPLSTRMDGGQGAMNESTTAIPTNATEATTMSMPTTPGSSTTTAPPIPISQPPTTSYSGRFGGSRLTPAPRFSPSSSTRAPLRDYLVYGIYPNKTIVRKRPEDNLIDARNVDSPYVIFGIFPDGRLVRKFPNGTIIPDPPRSPVEVVFSLSTTTTTNRPLPRPYYNQANQGVYNQYQGPVYSNIRRPEPMRIVQSPGTVDLGLTGNAIVGPNGGGPGFTGPLGTPASLPSTNEMSNALINTQMGTASVTPIVSTGRPATDSQGGRIVQDRERDEATRTKEVGGQRSSVYIGQDKFVNYWTDGASTTNPRVLNVNINSVATAANEGPAPSVPSFENLLNNQQGGGRVTAPPGFPWRDPLDQIFGITTSSPIITASVASNSLDDSAESGNPALPRPINPFVEVFTPFSNTIGMPGSNAGGTSVTGAVPSTTATMPTTPSTTTVSTTTTTMAPTTTTMAPTTTTTTTAAPTTTTTTMAPTTPSQTTSTEQVANIGPQGTAPPTPTSTSVPLPSTTPLNIPPNLLTNMQQQNAFGTSVNDLVFLNSLLQSNSRSSTTKTLTQVEQLLANKILSLALNGPDPGPTRAPKAINYENASPNSVFQSPKPSYEPIVIDLSPSSTAKTPAWKSLEQTSQRPSPSSSTPTQITWNPVTTTTSKRDIITSTISSSTTDKTTLISTTKAPVTVSSKPVTTPRPRTTTEAPLGFAGLLWQTLLGGGGLFGPSTTQRPVKSKPVKTVTKSVNITPKPPQTTPRSETTTVRTTTTVKSVDISKIYVNTPNSIVEGEKKATTPPSLSTTKKSLLNNPKPKLPNVATSTYSPEEDTKFLLSLLQAVQREEKASGSKKSPSVSQDDEAFLRAILSGRPLTTTPAPQTEISNAALLAALLKAQGIEPETPATNIREQLQLASLGLSVTSAPTASPATTESTTITTRPTSTATRPTDTTKNTLTPRPTSRPRIRTTTWSPSSTYPPPLFSSFSNYATPVQSAAADNSENRALFGATRAFSQFLGAALSGAAQQLQSLVRNGTRIVSEVVG